jgi:alanine dehydrogenase
MNMRLKKLGLPRMKQEAGERRVFLPEFVARLVDMGFEVFIEEGYGSRSGYTFDDYQQGNPLVSRVTRKEAFSQEYVLILRSPNPNEFDLIPSGTCLISMLHYPTRAARVNTLVNKGIKSISLDSIVDDYNTRLIENMKAVAWNGLEAAFDVLEKRFTDLKKPDGQPWKSLILGTGMVGKHAVDAATKLGNIERNNEHIENDGPGAIAWSIGRNISNKPEKMRELLAQVDVLVDASQRRDASLPVVPNEWIAWLPEHAVVVDLSVDPYKLDQNPPVVRGVEGIPQGDLNQYIFYPDDPHWCDKIPAQINTRERRTSVSCYSWPGIHPEACMRHYAQQLLPMMEVLAEKGCAGLSPAGSYFERALYRATLQAFLDVQTAHG